MTLDNGWQNDIVADGFYFIYYPKWNDIIIAHMTMWADVAGNEGWVLDNGDPWTSTQDFKEQKCLFMPIQPPTLPTPDLVPEPTHRISRRSTKC